MKSAVYAGSFDPLTNGHLDVIWRVLPHFDKINIVVATHPLKFPFFSVEERLLLLSETFSKEVSEKKIEIHSCSELIVNFCKKLGSKVLIRGLRSPSDFEAELQMSTMNKHLSSEIETFFVMTSQDYASLSSTLIKDIVRYGASLKGLVPTHIEIAMKKKLSEVK